MLRTTPAKLLILALTTQAALADGIPGYEELLGGPQATERGDTSPRNTTWRARNFDPMRDVPAMVNWIPKANLEGAAHCFAMSMLTAFFHRRIQFVDRPGVPLSTSWRPQDLRTRVVEPDVAGRHLLFEFLGGAGDYRLQVGRNADLRAFTREGTESEALFRHHAEAMQFSLQIPTMGLPYAKTILFASVDLCEKERYTPAGLNRLAFEKVRSEVAAGKLAVFTLHPSRVRTDGHVLVAYEVERQGTTDLVRCYDSNYPPTDRTARPTVIHFDRTAGTYEVRNHRGTASYTDYDVITFVDSENRVIRELTQRMTRYLDRYLWLTERFYALIETVQGDHEHGRWQQWRREFVDGWRNDKDTFEARTSRALRREVREDE